MNENNSIQPVAHLMLDLETLGTKPGSVILEIGAVIFWPDVPKMEPMGRKWRICPASCMEKGMAVDVATVVWWLNQPAEAQAAVLLTKDAPRLPLAKALAELKQWAEIHAVAVVWGKGPAFDLVFLAKAYEAVREVAWWAFYRERCVRTIYDLAPAGFEWAKPMVAHDSLCDAMAQAKNVSGIWQFVKRAGSAPKVAEGGGAWVPQRLGVSVVPAGKETLCHG